MSNIDWNAIRAEYEAGSSLRTLAAKYTVSKSVIGERKYKEKWEEIGRTPSRTQQDSQGVPNRDVNAAQRASTAISLRAQKLTYEQIAHRAGYSSASSCRKAILREMDRCISHNIDEMRREELYILDKLHSEVWQLAMNKENKGRLFAVDRLITISERRAKLMGLDVLRENNVAANMVVVREVPNSYLGEPQQ